MMSKDTVNSICNCQTKKKHHRPTCIEWIQLLVTFLVPVAIALYTFLQNNNEQVIALANREKDLEIARNQRAQDLQIAADQQKANILAAYESFLVSHLNRYGMTLNGSSSARFVARLKTLATVSQLDPIRKTFLIQSLFEAKLIVNDNNTNDRRSSGIIVMEDADLSDISFESRALEYLSLPKSNLTRAIFASADVARINFYSAVLINANFHRARALRIKTAYFLKSDYTIFSDAKMTGANFFEAQFIAVDFTGATLDYVNMSRLHCIGCLFDGANMFHADLSFSTIASNSTFVLTNLTKAILVSATFRSTTFANAKFIQIQATKVEFAQCLFASMNFLSCILVEASITGSNFSQIRFNDVNLSKSILRNVSFMNISMSYTDLSNAIFNQSTFINVNFNGAIVQNASFLNCIFQRSLISNEQRLQAASFNGSVFS